MGADLDACVADSVRNLIGAYAHALDAGRAGDIADLFCPDGVAEIAGTATFVGRDAIREGYGAWAPTVPQLHLVTNTVVDSRSAEQATATSDLAFFRRDPAGWVLHLVGRYEDTLHRTDGVWRFHHRVTTFR
ncbi:MAG TPA: nuclear transport factor 2 family protein [Rugosimonospora sp.]|nr:nuclear transport factor 2 family protein [Rugosimonospora sp.]